MKKILAVLAALLLTGGLVGCNDTSKPAEKPAAQAGTQSTTPEAQKKSTVTLGVTEITQTLFSPGVAWAKDNKGITVEMSLIDGNVNIIRAVQDGSIDAGLGVHSKFMEKFNQENKGSLVMVKPYPFTTGIGLYSNKFKRLDEFPQGTQIAIMSDAMNMDRGLRMLRDAGLITLDPSKKDGFTLLDIKENPRKVAFIDMDQTQTMRSLQDLDGAIIFFGHVKNAGRDPKSFILRDTDAELYPMGIVVKSGNESTPWANALAETLLSAPVREGIAKKFEAVFEYYK